MGAKHSKGATRAELHAVLPRSWSDLELFYARFQQESFRRRVSDPQSQFFLSFPVFRHVVAVVAKANGSDTEAWTHKEHLLRVFSYLDRARRKRIAAIDFFAGLSLVTKGKKAAKFEFLFSLLDNGGLKTLNACEVMMVLMAAARGLAMFKAIPPVDEESLRPLARRLLGDRQEVARAMLVEKALTDAEIVFFMNDLENESATTSDALLTQQGQLMKSAAANELQIGRIVSARPAVLVVASPPQKSPGTKKATRVLSAEAMLRRLQVVVQPPTVETGARDNTSVPASNPTVIKRIDPRSLCRLVNYISDGSQTLTKAEAKRIIASMPTTETGYAKSSDVLRSIRPWILRAAMSSPPVWQTFGRFASDSIARFEVVWGRWTVMKPRQVMLGEESRNAPTQGGIAAETNYSVKLNVNGSNVSPNAPVQARGTGAEFVGTENDEALRIRIHLHHQPVHSDGPTPTDDEFSANIAALTIVLNLRLRIDTTDEEAIDVASAVEQLMNDEAIRRHTDFAIERCEATVVESQAERSSDPGILRCLRVKFILKIDFLEMFESMTGCQLSNLVRTFHMSFDFDNSLEEIIRGATSVVDNFAQLVKPEERDKHLRLIFKRFDKDDNGLWSVQEFNTFQQALKEDAFDDTTFTQCFGARREIPFDGFADCYRHCSLETFRKILEKLGYGSPSSQITGTGEVNITVDEYQLRHLESSLSRLQWGDGVFKQMMFLLRNMTDFSCDFHCRSITSLCQTLGIDSTLWLPFECVTPIVSWFEAARQFMSPRHSEHEREFVCHSLICSLEDELSKSPQQLEQEDQQRNLPHGSSARLAQLLTKVRNAAAILLACVDGVESLSLEGPKSNLVCEIDNFNFVYLLRQAVHASSATK